MTSSSLSAPELYGGRDIEILAQSHVISAGQRNIQDFDVLPEIANLLFPVPEFASPGKTVFPENLMSEAGLQCSSPPCTLQSSCVN